MSESFVSQLFQILLHANIGVLLFNLWQICHKEMYVYNSMIDAQIKYAMPDYNENWTNLDLNFQKKKNGFLSLYPEA